MKRIWPYFILQMALVTLASCAALRGPSKDPDPTYAVSFTVAAHDESELHNAIAGIPALSLDVNHRYAVPSINNVYQLIELKIRGKGAVDLLKRSLAEAGITVASFHTQEVSL